MNGIFIISIDFELMWGVFDKRRIRSYGNNIIGARKAIPKILNLFKLNNIHASWATVGFLFANNKNEIIKYLPDKMPSYENNRYNPYDYLSNCVGDSEKTDPYHFAPSLIKLILENNGQEISSHTFSHYYCLEKGQTLEQFDADTKSLLAIATDNDINIKSIVFPRNQFSDDYLKVCKKHNINIYRSNPNSLIYQEKSQNQRSNLVRGFKAFDSVLPIDGYHGYKASITNGMTNISASRFLRPISRTMPSLVSALLLRRVLVEMEHAAINGHCYHLWWHPHNFGSDVELNINHLSKIIDKYKILNEKYGMVSKNMSGV
ncbi:polysaccharide deacetylase family protein [Photobacterium sp. Alg240-V54]|uniref:polysaccharide deacetylase family protein n=1 Tax=Photobacterium sp. Alg240-V54 TaxID=2305995 RepID=UPI0013D87B13|nr:polysaccharide deacetylase family protein [Photobacterium sp. Alg240-V54]